MFNQFRKTTIVDYLIGGLIWGILICTVYWVVTIIFTGWSQIIRDFFTGA